MSLARGQMLGPYEILEPIGAGGMGEVWKARDTRLNRIIAIKTSQERFSERFAREARAAAALNHPNICTLHDVGPDFLVMEFVEGRPAIGPVPRDEALRIAIQIASALETAHRAGVVHRDLKPANVLLTKSGAKLLDFGLAKIQPAAEAASELAETRTLTQEGALIGTLQFMSPEQLQGKPASPRSDIFAFGAVLYNLLTGRQAFGGSDPASLAAAILTSEPAPMTAEQPVSGPLDRIVRRCLAKDPDRRWQTATDLREELEWVAGLDAAANITRRSTRWVVAGWWAAAAMLVAAVTTWLWPRHPAESEPAARFKVDLPYPVNRSSLLTPHVSPDGRTILFGQSSPLKAEYWLHHLSTGKPVPVKLPSGIQSVSWSPDSRELIFQKDRKLVRLDPATGTMFPLGVASDDASLAPAWGPAGFLLACEERTIWLLPPDGSVRTPVTNPSPNETHWFPEPLPDGTHFLYKADMGGPPADEVYLGDIKGGPPRVIFRVPGRVHFAEPGYLLFMQGDALRAIEFDARKNAIQGVARTVTSGVASNDVTGWGMFTASRTGVLAFLGGSSSRLSRLTWFDRNGRSLGTVGEPANYINPAISPDGKTLAVDIRDQQSGKRDIWLLDLSRGAPTRFTFDPGEEFSSVFSPDGTRIAFSSDRTGTRRLYISRLSGTREGEQAGELYANSVLSWSPDGRAIIVDQFRNFQSDIHVVDLSSPPPRMSSLLASRFAEGQASVSPDGRWIAYSSNESGRREVYVQSFPPGLGKWQISTSGGTEPQWRGDGKEMFFAADNKLMAADVRSAGAQFEAGAPQELFELRLPTTVLRNRWVVTRDGKRFLAAIAEEEPQLRSFEIILNWPSLLVSH